MEAPFQLVLVVTDYSGSPEYCNVHFHKTQDQPCGA